jgi:hypothetical protein
MQGHADVASRFIPQLLKKLFKEKNIHLFDCIIYLFQPMLLIVLAISLVMGFVQGVYPDMKIWFMPYTTVPPLVWNLFYFSQLCFVPVVLWLEKKLTVKAVIYYIPYLLFTYTWMPIAFIGVANKNKKVWFHTQHTRTISISEVE